MLICTYLYVSASFEPRFIEECNIPLTFTLPNGDCLDLTLQESVKKEMYQKNGTLHYSLIKHE